MNDPVIGDRIDAHSLLRQAKEELASTLGAPSVKAERELARTLPWLPAGWEVRVCVFPEGEEVPVSIASTFFVSVHYLGSGQLQVRECAPYEVLQDAAMVNLVSGTPLQLSVRHRFSGKPRHARRRDRESPGLRLWVWHAQS